jgi:hypothetical protein
MMSKDRPKFIGGFVSREVNRAMDEESMKTHKSKSLLLHEILAKHFGITLEETSGSEESGVRTGS